MSKVLVTGGAGFIGSHTVDKLIELGFEVRILDNLQKPIHLKGKPSYINPKAEFIFGDVRDKKMLEYALDGVEYIFHLAAYQDYLPDFSTFFDVNTFSTALLYEIIVSKKLKIKKNEKIYEESKFNNRKSYRCRKSKIGKRGLLRKLFKR